VTVLLVIAINVAWGLTPALAAAVVAVILDDVLLAQPSGAGGMTIVGDMADLTMLVAVAVVVNRLVIRARHAQAAAERAAARERHAREERERLIATVAHDLAAPLTAVRGTVQTAKRFGLAQDEDRHRLFGRIDTAAARASSLVSTLAALQDFAGVRPDRMQLVDLRGILRTVADMMAQVSERHPFVLELPETPIRIEADPERLQSVFENLLSNAIKYSPGGGAVVLSAQEVNNRGTVTVRDHGMGITPEARNRIFELSYRAPEALTASSGRGLGLHIAAQIVSAHGGTIAARAASGGGTAIVVSLPIAEIAPRVDGEVSTATSWSKS
jgi:signal transduction histidine kinase